MKLASQLNMSDATIESENFVTFNSFSTVKTENAQPIDFGDNGWLPQIRKEKHFVCLNRVLDRKSHRVRNERKPFTGHSWRGSQISEINLIPI